MSPVFVLQLKMQGSLCWQAERKESPSTLIPDVDNAAVGNAFTSVAGGYHIRYSPVFSCSFERRERFPHKSGGLRGSALSLGSSAMGSRVPA